MGRLDVDRKCADIHPDPYYKVYASTDQERACHRGVGPAGYYGAETSDCDSPISLLNETFRWINATLKDEIDFIIWTGDSARHDNDEKLPRDENQVASQNELVVSKFLEVFGKPENYEDDDPTNDFLIPIIPTFGNNDILPHNIFTEGPNHWTQKYLQIWQQFIPEAQRHQFARGGWFFVEVIPNELAVFSLNTLYFFASNSAVDGCSRKSEAGYEQMEWLRIQLELIRQRGMKAILTGHVPPARVDAKTSWDETCWQKYALWLQQYRDVIVASIYGHMNIDHFMVQDFNDINKQVKNGMGLVDFTKSEWEDEMSISATTDYLVGLRNQFAKIPPVENISDIVTFEPKDMTLTQRVLSLFKDKKDDQKPLDMIGGLYAERFSISLIGASVVPNYFPSIRVVEYNISGLESIVIPDRLEPSGHGDEVAEIMEQLEAVDDNEQIEKKKKKYKFTVPKGPSKSSPPGPAYSPQTLTLNGFTVYYANLTHINNDFLHSNEEGEEVGDEGWKSGKHKGKSKQGKSKPKKFKFNVEYTTNHDKVYQMEDLTVRNWLRLARRIAGEHSSKSTADLVEERNGDAEAEKKNKKHNKKHKKNGKGGEIKNKTWLTFIRRAFVGAMEPVDLEEQFGGGLDLYGNMPLVGDENLEL